jgi:hypothetical protein
VFFRLVARHALLEALVGEQHVTRLAVTSANTVRAVLEVAEPAAAQTKPN